MADYFDIPFVGQSFEGRSVELNSQSAVNWYLEDNRHDAITPMALMPTPGLAVVDSVGAGTHRGAIEFKGDAYFVVGSDLVKMTTSETFTTVGTLLTTSGSVSMASNGYQGDQMIIVDGTYGYLWDGTTLSQITFGFSVSPEFVVFLDSYFLINNKDTGQFYRSAINNGNSWSSTDVATAERDPDNLNSLAVNQRDLWLFGEYTTEVWYNDASSFGFGPYNNALIEWGILAHNSVATAEHTVLWLSQNRNGKAQVMQGQGNQAKPVTTRGIEYTFQTYSTLEDATAYTYQQAGHTFYVLNFPTENVTWVYDLFSHSWHTRSSVVNGVDARHLGETHLYFNGKNYIGDYDSGNLYTYDLGVYTDNGESIKRKRITPHLTSHLLEKPKEGKTIRYRQLEVWLGTGIGLTSGQGSEPTLGLRWSDDGGHTWSNKRYATASKKGQYGYRMIFSHLGASRDRIFEITVSDPVKWVLIKVLAKVQLSAW